MGVDGELLPPCFSSTVVVDAVTSMIGFRSPTRQEAGSRYSTVHSDGVPSPDKSNDRTINARRLLQTPTPNREQQLSSEKKQDDVLENRKTLDTTKQTSKISAAP